MTREDVASNMAGPHRQPNKHTRLACFERCTVVPDLTAVCSPTGRVYLGGTGLAVSARVKASSSLKSASSAARNTPFKRHEGVSEQVLVRGSTHSTRRRSVSEPRTTSPMRMSVGVLGESHASPWRCTTLVFSASLTCSVFACGRESRCMSSPLGQGAVALPAGADGEGAAAMAPVPSTSPLPHLRTEGGSRLKMHSPYCFDGIFDLRCILHAS